MTMSATKRGGHAVVEKEPPMDDHAGHDSHGSHAAQGGHDAHGGHGDHAAVFRRKFWLSLVLTVPVVLYSHMLMQLTGWTLPSFPGSHLVGAVFGTAVFLYGGRVFLAGGWAEARSRRPGMMLLISMGLVVAFGGSVATSLGLLNVDLWPELLTLVTIMLLGHWLEMRSLGQALADRAAALLFYVATASGAATFIAWWALGDLNAAFVRTVTVLVIACPHALGLAIPLVISISTSVAARAGILVKDRLALERMRDIDAVVFDKTGTLTKGNHVLSGLAATGIPEDELLALAASAGAESDHPVAKAIVEA